MTKELAKKTDKELKDEVRVKKETLRAFRFALAGSKTRNVREGRKTRKEIAQMLTEINRRKA